MTTFRLDFDPDDYGDDVAAALRSIVRNINCLNDALVDLNEQEAASLVLELSPPAANLDPDVASCVSRV